MTNSHPTDPREFQDWVNELEQKWLDGLVPDPQGVAVIVLNDQDKVLLQLRDNNPDIVYPNCWTLPGGIVDPNETPEQAARRELNEETGLNMILSFWKSYKRKSDSHAFSIEQFVYHGNTKKSPKEMILGEGQALQFFSQDELSDLEITFDFDTLLYEFFEQRKVVG